MLIQFGLGLAIPIPEEGGTVAAPYEGGAAILTATFFPILDPFFLQDPDSFFSIFCRIRSFFGS